jgi:hypothetical protein
VPDHASTEEEREIILRKCARFN